jgi:hypothetical protein
MDYNAQKYLSAVCDSIIDRIERLQNIVDNLSFDDESQALDEQRLLILNRAIYAIDAVTDLESQEALNDFRRLNTSATMESRQ